VPTGGCPHPFGFLTSSSELDPAKDSEPFIISQWGSRFAYCIVKPTLQYPPPTNIRFQFWVRQGPFRKRPPSDPFQYGSGFIVGGFYPGQPVTGLEYEHTLQPWPNVYPPHHLADFDKNVPFP
jgi:hypothetical protein